MKKSNHITNLACFEQVASVIGRGKAQLELFKARKQIDKPYENDIYKAITYWVKTQQGGVFWAKVREGINPYD